MGWSGDDASLRSGLDVTCSHTRPVFLVLSLAEMGTESHGLEEDQGEGLKSKPRQSSPRLRMLGSV